MIGSAARAWTLRPEVGHSYTFHFLGDCGSFLLRSTRLTYPDSTYITYDYDQLNRLTAVRNSSGTALASYTYDVRSRRTGLEYVNGASIAYSYDAASRLLSIDNQTGNGQHKHTYTYDYVGNRMTMAVTDNSGTAMHVYDYDSIYQLTGVDYPTGFDPLLATDTTFGYDAAGNRTSVIDGSGTCTYTTNNLNQYTAAGTDSFTYSLSGNMTHDPNFHYTYDPENRLTKLHRSGETPGPGGALAEAVDSGLSYTTGGDADWQPTNWPYHYGGDSAEGTAWRNSNSWMQTEVEGAGTLKFWWKVSSESGGDYLEFYIDDQLQNYPISGEQAWAEKTYTITGSGPHTLRWQYTKDDDDTTEGDDTGWVDYVQWSGQVPQPQTWTEVEYVYDPAGRRIEKKYDGATVLKYLYDGDHCIAEYNASNNLARKYVYGPCVDEPICMIEAAGDYAGTYYYHYDALGSVIALSDPDGDTVQVYEYDVYGRVGASDASHPNRFLFTGREFDQETGLYYYRARYYNPQVGRFLQTDPIGYGDGMNWYAYCGNSPVAAGDPTGTDSWGFRKSDKGYLVFWYQPDNGKERTGTFEGGIDEWLGWVDGGASGWFSDRWMRNQIGWEMAGWNTDAVKSTDPAEAAAQRLANQKWWFWRLQAVMTLDPFRFDAQTIRKSIGEIEADSIYRVSLTRGANGYNYRGDALSWSSGTTRVYNVEPNQPWFNVHPLAALAHELEHAIDDFSGYNEFNMTEAWTETSAVIMENRIRGALFALNPQSANLYPRPGYRSTWETPRNANGTFVTAAQAWGSYHQRNVGY